MSADNWTQCPQCRKNEEANVDDLDKRVVESYGKVSADEYLKLVKQSREAADALSNHSSAKDTLREDWDIGILKGQFYAYYGASCSVCGFEFTFKHEEELS